MTSILRFAGAAVLVALAAAQARAATITVMSDTTVFRVMKYPNQNDYYNELQTGDPAADIVGNEQHSGFYTAFDGSYSYFRVRLGSYDDKGYRGVLWIGIDADSDGGPDLFIAINNQGSNRSIQFQAAGAGANLSPSTTTIETSTAAYRYNYTRDVDYHYAPVGPQLEPGLVGLDLDLDRDSGTDSFLTFGVRFLNTAGSPSLQSAMQGLAGINLTPTTPLSYVIATATQDNSMNQDIGGLPRNFNGNLTWRKLGGISARVYANGDVVTPEPDTWLLMAAGLALVVLGCRSKARRS